MTDDKTPEKAVTIDDAISLMNELIALDKSAVIKLLLSRVECNQALANHPTVQVAGTCDEFGREVIGPYSVGLVGILNGLFGIDTRTGGGLIRYVMEEGELVRFERNY